MSTLAFWLLILLLILVLAAIVGVGLAVRTLLRRTHRMLTELEGLSSDITDVVRSTERETRLRGTSARLPYDGSETC